MDMIMPISMAPKYLYLGSTRIEIDQQEEYKDEQEKCEEKQNYEFIWPASFDDAGCQASQDKIVAQEESDAEQDDDAEQEDWASDNSSEDSEFWRDVFGY